MSKKTPGRASGCRSVLAPVGELFARRSPAFEVTIDKLSFCASACEPGALGIDCPLAGVIGGFAPLLLAERLLELSAAP